MRITVLANKDLASNIAINQLLNLLPQHPFRIFLSAQVGGNQTRPQAIQELAFYEQALFNRLLFPALEYRKKPAKGVLKTFAEIGKQNVSVQDISSVNCEEGVSHIAAGKPELIISIRFGLILKPQVITLPEFGVLNLHSGILPEYRGVMASFWAMLNDDDLGTSLHYIDNENIDTGAIIKIDKHRVDLTKSYLWNVLQLYGQGVQSIADAVSKVERKESIEAASQAVGAGHYYGFPTEEDVHKFQQKGLKLFDFEELLDIAKLYY